MTLYAVFICTALAGREVCQPTAFRDDRTETACSAHKRYMEPLARPGVTIVCMKKTVPAWEPAR